MFRSNVDPRAGKRATADSYLVDPALDQLAKVPQLFIFSNQVNGSSSFLDLKLRQKPVRGLPISKRSQHPPRLHAYP